MKNFFIFYSGLSSEVYKDTFAKESNYIAQNPANTQSAENYLLNVPCVFFKIHTVHLKILLCFTIVT